MYILNMKTFFLSVFLLSLLFSCSKTTTPVIPDDGRPVSFKQLKDLFENPSPEYRTAPFWVWNNDVSKEDIDRSLEEFIDITMPGYERVPGSEFGKRVPGVFTDEPNINTRSAGPVRYTPDLYEEFEKQWGYKLQPHLMSLITETGDWKKIRHNYRSVLLRLFIERWSVPWYEYTENKDLLWTGHYWEHGWPNPKEGPDNMAMYAWHRIPGIDMLFNAEDLRSDQFGNVRNVRELASVANQFGRKRALSETYGAAGWELTFEDMKRLGDWKYVSGS